MSSSADVWRTRECMGTQRRQRDEDEDRRPPHCALRPRDPQTLQTEQLQDNTVISAQKCLISNLGIGVQTTGEWKSE